jgi:hypothetical protein
MADRRVHEPGAARHAHADAATSLSTPPAMTISSAPCAILAAPRLTASRPEAQKRLICMPGGLGRSQPRRRRRAGMTAPASPTGSTQPIDHVVDQLGIEAVAVAHGVVDASSFLNLRGAKAPTAGTSCSDSVLLAAPRGVRTAS